LVMTVPLSQSGKISKVKRKRFPSSDHSAEVQLFRRA
jgi:hypothetical protein